MTKTLVPQLLLAGVCDSVGCGVGFSVVGSLLAMAFLLINKEGFLTTSGEKLRGFLRISAIIWVIGAFGTIIFTLAQILGTTFSDALDLTVLRSILFASRESSRIQLINVATKAIKIGISPIAQPIDPPSF